MSMTTDPPLLSGELFRKARAKGVFDKLWKDTFEDKPWLQLILQYTIYAFIENQGYTLAEFPYFFRNSRFREAIVRNMRYNRIVKNYWLDFTFRSKRLQETNWRPHIQESR